MAIIKYQIIVKREGGILKDKWGISVSTTRRGTFIESGDFGSKANAIRIARSLFRLNREPDISLKGLAKWVEER